MIGIMTALQDFDKLECQWQLDFLQHAAFWGPCFDVYLIVKGSMVCSAKRTARHNFIAFHAAQDIV